jgi:glutathione synthase/RimK-type ligase-like ATP-grasp enzyme
MGKTLIIGRRNSGEKNDIAVLAAALSAASPEHAIEYAYYDDFVFTIGEQATTNVKLRRETGMADVRDYQLLIFFHWTADRVLSDTAYSLAMYAHHHGASIWNSELLGARSMSKLSQVMKLALAGLTVPKTIFSLDHALLRQAAQEQALLPAVYKDITASRGRYNELAKSEQDVERVLTSMSGRPLIAQAFVRNDGSDVRFFVAGRRVKLVIKRSGAEGSHLNNVSTGGQAVLIPLESVPVAAIREAEKVAALFGRELCGVDYMLDLDTQTYIFLEINGTPQIVNGVFVDEKIKVIVDQINEQINEDLET